MLKFTSEEERASHPEGKLFNSFLMETFFNSTLTENQIDLLSGKLGLVDFSHLLSHATDTERLKLLICYILSKESKLDRLPTELTAHLSSELIVRAAALTAQFNLIKQIEITPESLEEILDRRDIANSLMMMDTGRPFIDFLNFDISPNLKAQEIFMPADYRYFIAIAAQNGHIDLLNYIEGRMTQPEIQQAIKGASFRPYRLAALNGHRDVLIHIEKKLDEPEIKEAIKSHRFEAYRFAAQNKHLHVLAHIQEILDESEIKEAAKAYLYHASQLVAKNRHLDFLTKLDGKLPESEIKEAIKAYSYDPYQFAAENGRLDVLTYFESKLLDPEIKEALRAGDFASYRYAAQYGYFDLLTHIEEKLDKSEIKKAIRAASFYAYRFAAENGRLDVLRHIEEKLDEHEIQEAMRSNLFYAYRFAIENGRHDVVAHIEEKLDGAEIEEAIRAYEFGVYRHISKNGWLDLLIHIEGKLPESKIKEAIRANNFGAYRLAAENGQLDMLNHIEEKLGELETQEAIRANSFQAYYLATQNEHFDVVKHLLKDSACFAYAEEHDYEYGENHIYGYVSWCVDRLKQEKRLFESTVINDVFDIEPDEAPYAFYLLRNLIRRGVDRDYGDVVRNAEDLSNEIRFLLSIPAVKALCHETINVDEESLGQENELLRLANRIGNEEAASILLQLPDVRRLAEGANFYSADAEDNLDLRQIAQDCESSMGALSGPERKFVSKAASYYQETIREKGGNEAVFSQFKKELIARYKESPAILTLPIYSGEIESEQDIKLPLEWSELQSLRRRLTPAEYESALKAYYEHDVHAAYRYLSTPNYWMASEASYVNVYFNEAGERTNLRYSTYEDYQSLISLFYIAAFDENMPAIDGYTLETRKALFIKQLALIGRAHNWDKRDTRCQEADDGKADRPSCFSGVNRRLFQSVLGHGLFKVVTRQIVTQALEEHIRAYFEKTITPQNALKLQKAYNAIIVGEEDGETHLKTLQTINMSDKEKDALINATCSQLSKCYKNNFDAGQSDFINYMKRHLNSSASGAHFIDFQAPCGLDTLLEQRVQAYKETKMEVDETSPAFAEQDLFCILMEIDEPSVVPMEVYQTASFFEATLSSTIPMEIDEDKAVGGPPRKMPRY